MLLLFSSFFFHFHLSVFFQHPSFSCLPSTYINDSLLEAVFQQFPSTSSIIFALWCSVSRLKLLAAIFFDFSQSFSFISIKYVNSYTCSLKVTLRRLGEFLVLSVPGLAEGRPSVMIGDRVVVDIRGNGCVYL